MTSAAPAAPIADLSAVLRPRWWQHPAVRIGAGTVVTLALLAALLYVPADWHWRLGPRTGPYLLLTRTGILWAVGLLLMPFMRKVSYRKRDVLLVVLVPLYGQYLAGKLLYRLLGLPRRDWLPRPAELPGVVRIPHGYGTYLLLPSFEEAEELRTRWCVNPEHDHPYPSWESAQQAGCRRHRPVETSGG